VAIILRLYQSPNSTVRLVKSAHTLLRPFAAVIDVAVYQIIFFIHVVSVNFSHAGSQQPKETEASKEAAGKGLGTQLPPTIKVLKLSPLRIFFNII